MHICVGVYVSVCGMYARMDVCTRNVCTYGCMHVEEVFPGLLHRSEHTRREPSRLSLILIEVPLS